MSYFICIIILPVLFFAIGIYTSSKYCDFEYVSPRNEHLNNNDWEVGIYIYFWWIILPYKLYRFLRKKIVFKNNCSNCCFNTPSMCTRGDFIEDGLRCQEGELWKPIRSNT